jgi:hypothetical protein
MAWGRMDDTFHDHPKVEELSLAAVGLWTKCLTVALRHVDTAPRKGFVSEKTVRAFAGGRTKALVAELVTPIPGKTTGLWERVDGGYLIHDFTDYLPKKRDPSEASKAGKKGAAARWSKDGSSHGNSHGSPDGNSHSSSGGSSMAVDGPRASAPAFPSRPDPSVTTEDQDLGGDRHETLPAADATQPPPGQRPPSTVVGGPRCTLHAGVADPGPCRGCQAARERAEREGDRAQDAARRDLERRARQCTACDGVHVTDENNLPTRRKCDHPDTRRTA